MFSGILFIVIHFSFSKDGNKNVHLQYAMLYKEEETQLVFMAQLKAYNVIPLHL